MRLLTAKLNARLDGLAAEYAVAAAANVQDLLTADVRTSRVTTIGEDTGTSIRQVETHTRDVARDSQRIIDFDPGGRRQGMVCASGHRGTHG